MKKTIAIATVLMAVALGVSGCTPTKAVMTELDHANGIAEGSGTQQDVTTLRVGECLNDADAQNIGSDGVSSVAVVDCSLAHDAEVYKNITIPDDTYPGDSTLASNADTLCQGQAFTDYIGTDYDSATLLDITDYYPTNESWIAGDRSITCEVFAVDDADTQQRSIGSAKGLKGERTLAPTDS